MLEIAMLMCIVGIPISSMWKSHIKVQVKGDLELTMLALREVTFKILMSYFGGPV